MLDGRFVLGLRLCKIKADIYCEYQPVRRESLDMNRSKFFAVLAFLFALTAPLAVTVTAAQAQSSSFGDGAAVVFDDAAANDGVKIDISGVAAAPEGMEYVAWLVTDDSEGFLNVGTLAVANGEVRHTYTSGDDSDGANLIQMYSGWAISVEDAGSGASLREPTNQGIVYDRIAADSMAEVRKLDTAIRQATAQLALAMACAQSAREATDAAEVTANIQCAINLLEGAEGDNYDASVGASGGDGVGILNHVADVQAASDILSDKGEERPELGTLGASAAIANRNAANWAEGARNAAVEALGKDDVTFAKLFVGPGGNSVISLLDAASNGYDMNGDGVLNEMAVAEKDDEEEDTGPPEAGPAETGAGHIVRFTQLAATLKTVTGELPVVSTPTPTPAPTATPEPTATPTPTPLPQPAGPGLPGVGGLTPSASALAMLLGIALAIAIGGLTALRANRGKA